MTRPGCGLPIGSLTSQLFSNIYLNGLDHFCKSQNLSFILRHLIERKYEHALCYETNPYRLLSIENSRRGFCSHFSCPFEYLA